MNRGAFGQVRIVNRRRSPWLQCLWVLPLWLMVALPLLFACIAIFSFKSYVGDLPEVPKLRARIAELPQSSLVFAADGTLLAKFPFTDGEVVGHRDLCRIDELPKKLVDAILAAEDRRFFTHQGVDVRAIVRAAKANWEAKRNEEGASTITQQLARNLLPSIGTEKKLRRKVREAILALRLENNFSKEEILEAYVNLVFLGGGAYGFKTAARHFYSKTLRQLSLSEAALLAGQIQAPSRRDPFEHFSRARTRQKEVLERMRDYGLISEGEFGEARADEPRLRPWSNPAGERAPWLTELVRGELYKKFRADYQRGGLLVTTTAEVFLESDLQELASTHVADLRRDSATPNLGLALVDHHSGYIEGVIGGRDFEENQFNRATQACRQPGSAFKPVVYGAALDHRRITPATPLRDGPIASWDETMKIFWKPTNSGRSFRGMALASDALALSLNAPTIEVFDRVGADAVIAFARRLKITSELTPVRPLALGASCVPLMELLGVYSAIATLGRRVDPVAIKTIKRGAKFLSDQRDFRDPALSAGERLNRFVASLARPREEVMRPETAFQLKSMLREAVVRGTAKDARRAKREVAGKTGTTNGNVDAWFAGVTHRLTGVVWIGHDDPSRELGRGLDGSHAALPLWVDAVALAEYARPKRRVLDEAPEGMVELDVVPETGERSGLSGRSRSFFFERGTEPDDLGEQGRPSQGLDLGRESTLF